METRRILVERMDDETAVFGQADREIFVRASQDNANSSGEAA
jgi:hypothetical protein